MSRSTENQPRVGARFDYKGVKLEVVEEEECNGCYFDSLGTFCNFCPAETPFPACTAYGRCDGKNVIFKEVGRRATTRPIGEVFEMEGVTLKVVEGSECRGCYYEDGAPNCSSPIGTGFCGESARSDEKNVVFVEVKKGGKKKQ